MCGKHLYIPGKSNGKGLVCNSVLVMEFIEARNQYFIQISYDRKKMMPVITYSKRGGMTLEALRNFYPETIKEMYVDVEEGIDLKEVSHVANDLELQEQQSTLCFLIKNLYECFKQRDCTFIQISPLVLTKDNKFRAANVIVHVDSDALFRQ